MLVIQRRTTRRAPVVMAVPRKMTSDIYSSLRSHILLLVHMTDLKINFFSSSICLPLFTQPGTSILFWWKHKKWRFVCIWETSESWSPQKSGNQLLHERLNGPRNSLMSAPQSTSSLTSSGTSEQSHLGESMWSPTFKEIHCGQSSQAMSSISIQSSQDCMSSIQG